MGMLAGMTRLTSCLVAMLALCAGCGDDRNDDSGNSGTYTGADGTSSASTTAEGGSASASADGGAEVGETGTGTTDTADAGTEGETGQAIGCGDFEDEASCMAGPNCMALFGRSVKQNGPDAPCMEPSAFIDCVDAMACDQAETWFCVGGNAKPILMSTGCGPANADPCDPPADSIPDCP